MTIDRPMPPPHADERTTLEGWLDFYRITLALKCEGLSEQQVRTASVPPSPLTLLGLVQHMAEVERSGPRPDRGTRTCRARRPRCRSTAVVPLPLRHRHRAPSSIRWGETMLSVLTDGGLTGERRAIAFRAIMGYVFGAPQVEYFGALSGPGTAALAELPPDEFPILSETARQARKIPPEVEFRRGFDILLRGLGL